MWPRWHPFSHLYNGEFCLLYLLGSITCDNVCKTIYHLRNHFYYSSALKNTGFWAPEIEHLCLVLPDSLGLIYLQNFSALVAENSITWHRAKYSAHFMGFWRRTYQSWESNWKLSSPVWCLTVLYILKENHIRLLIWSLVVMIVINFQVTMSVIYL